MPSSGVQACTQVEYRIYNLKKNCIHNKYFLKKINARLQCIRPEVPSLALQDRERTGSEALPHVKIKKKNRTRDISTLFMYAWTYLLTNSPGLMSSCLTFNSKVTDSKNKAQTPREDGSHVICNFLLKCPILPNHHII